MIDFCLSGSLVDTKIVHHNQKCEVGLPECEQSKEECVPKSARSRSGVCMCIDGYTRSSSGLCTSMFDGRLYSEKNTFWLGNESEMPFNCEHDWQLLCKFAAKLTLNVYRWFQGQALHNFNLPIFSIFNFLYNLYKLFQFLSLLFFIFVVLSVYISKDPIND